MKILKIFLLYIITIPFLIGVASALHSANTETDTFTTFSSGGTHQNSSSYTSETAVGQLAATQKSDGNWTEQEGIFYIMSSMLPASEYLLVAALGLFTGFFVIFLFSEEVSGKHWPLKMLLFLAMLLFLLILFNCGLIMLMDTSITGLGVGYKVLVGVVVFTTFYLLIFLFQQLMGWFAQSRNDGYVP